MPRKLSIILTAGAALLSSASAGYSQEDETPAHPGFGLGAYVVWNDLSGNDFQRSSAGWGGEVTGRYTWMSGLQLVAGAHYNVNSVDDLDDDIGLLMLFLDARYVFRMFNSPRVGPFLGGRAAYVKATLGDLSAPGISLGGVAGVLWEFMPNKAVEFSGYFGGIWVNKQLIPNLPNDTDDDNGSLGTLQLGIVWSV
jgi:hypothetical protein